VHGFDESEQSRLRRQAEFMETVVYRDIDFSECKSVLEVGCGVGAQTAILLRRFPKIHVTAVDASDVQLEACRKYLASLPYTQGRYEVRKMNATDMELPDKTFDGAFLCWILEHIPKPQRVLNEVHRVLQPAGCVYLTEVMNHAFFLDPYSPAVWKYWMAFNDFQFDMGGDPFVGAKLGGLLNSAGFRHVHTHIISTLLDNRSPNQRKQSLIEREELLLSAADQLLKANYITATVLEDCKRELQSVQVNPDAVIMDAFMQARATV
jgi:ubiquinone/menaquinone biosynthesis C-methylase UbiE